MAQIDYYPSYLMALERAKDSPCLRRKYGAVILTESDKGETLTWTTSYNRRISNCCNGGICVRDRFATGNGERSELGAEVHAEQSVLALRRLAGRDLAFILAGYDKHGKVLQGPDVFPCHVCALLIADAGFKYVWMEIEAGNIEPISIYDIIAHRESTWYNETNV